MKPYRAFPPGRGNLKIPVSSRRAARAGLSLYAPCRRKGRLARWGAWRLVDVFGPRALPGTLMDWDPPVDREVWMALGERWTDLAGPYDGMAIYERIQASRSGFAALLLAAGRPLAFVKVREADPGPLQREHAALEGLAGSSPRSFDVPVPLAFASLGDWSYLATSALRPDLHRVPRDPPINEIAAEIRAGLASLPRPDSTPEHWEPMHGDFTPWNLRERRDGTLFLIDWEDAGWAPHGADEVYYLATMEVLGFRGGRDHGDVAIREFWRLRLQQRIVRNRSAGDPDAQLGEALLRALE